MFAALVVLASSCSSDDPLPTSVRELTFEELSGEWDFGSNGFIRVDGSDVSANYPGFSLSFAEGTYTTSNAGNLFSASGTWEWAGDDRDLAEQINLDDGKVITIEAIGTEVLIFTFTKSDGPVRAGVAGNYRVRVEK